MTRQDLRPLIQWRRLPRRRKKCDSHRNTHLCHPGGDANAPVTLTRDLRRSLGEPPSGVAEVRETADATERVPPVWLRLWACPSDRSRQLQDCSGASAGSRSASVDGSARPSRMVSMIIESSRSRFAQRASASRSPARMRRMAATRFVQPCCSRLGSVASNCCPLLAAHARP